MGPTKSPLTICGLVLQRLPTLNEVIEATDDARSAYDWTTFEEDEVVLWEGKPHRYSLIPAFVIGVIFAIILIGLIILAWAWVDWKNTTYVITNRGVYRKRGALSREVKRVSFEKIQNTSLKQGRHWNSVRLRERGDQYGRERRRRSYVPGRPRTTVDPAAG